MPWRKNIFKMRDEIKRKPNGIMFAAAEYEVSSVSKPLLAWQVTLRGGGGGANIGADAGVDRAQPAYLFPKGAFGLVAPPDGMFCLHLAAGMTSEKAAIHFWEVNRHQTVQMITGYGKTLQQIMDLLVSTRANVMLWWPLTCRCIRSLPTPSHVHYVRIEPCVSVWTSDTFIITFASIDWTRRPGISLAVLDGRQGRRQELLPQGRLS